MRHLFLLLLMSLSLGGQAQPNLFTWQHSYGGPGNDEGGFAVAQQGGYLLAGQRPYPGSTARVLYFVQTDARGDTLWTKMLVAPSTLTPQLTGFVRNQAGTLLVTGLDYNSNMGFAMALDANCNELWSWTKSLTAHAVPNPVTSQTYISKPTVDADDNFLLFQSEFSTNGTAYINDDAILKINQRSGEKIWLVRVDSVLNRPAAVGALTWITTGPMATIGGSGQVGQLRLSSAGNFLSYHPILSPSVFAKVAWHDGLGNILLTGRQHLIKLTPQGDTLWHTVAPERIPGRPWDGVSIAQDAQGNYVVLGNSVSSTGNFMHLARFRATGELANDTLLGRSGDTFGRTILLAANGDVVISGYGDNAPLGGSDIFLLQYRGLRPLAAQAHGVALAGQLHAYPNPAGAGSSTVTLALPAGVRGGTLHLYDALGRLRQQQFVQDGAPLPVGGLPPGFYILRLTTADGRRWTTRLLRE